MMNKLYLIILMIASLPNLVFSQIILQVEIENIKNDSGNIIIELLDADEKSVEGKRGKIENGRSLIIFENLKASNYAVRYFHDKNENEKLDTNFLGIPKEGYGFSNNAYGTFGPKDFKEWLFLVSEDSKITLQTKN